MTRPRISFFGSSLVSAYWNGAATYYRGIIRALHRSGYDVTFYEPDAYSRQQHRDIPDPDWAHVVVYEATESGVAHALADGATADIVIKTSGVGVFDEWLDEAVLTSSRWARTTIFWDVDAPATLDRVSANPADPFRRHIPKFDLILTYGGGQPVIDGYTQLGARACMPIYNGLDPDTHFPAPRDGRFRAHLAFLGNRLPDRESRVDEFFFRAAERCPDKHFVLGGNGWDDRSMPANVDYLGHVFTAPQRVQLLASRRAEYQPGEHGALRLFTGDPGIRSRRRRCVPDYGRVARHRHVLRTGPRDSRGRRWQ